MIKTVEGMGILKERDVQGDHGISIMLIYKIIKIYRLFIGDILFYS